MGLPRTKTTQLEPAGLADIRQELELDLVLGRLRPRQRLIEDELMERFDAKRHLIRSALAELERNGLVERRPNKGAQVREYTSDEVEDIYSFRADLHRLAVQRMPLPMPFEVLDGLRDLTNRHENAIGRGDLADVILCNNAFHDLLFDQCGNSFLADSIRQLGWASHAIRSYRVGDPVLLKQAAREHRQIIVAVAEANREKLAQLCEVHIQPSKDMYLRDQLTRAD